MARRAADLGGNAHAVVIALYKHGLGWHVDVWGAQRTFPGAEHGKPGVRPRQSRGARATVGEGRKVGAGHSNESARRSPNVRMFAVGIPKCRSI